MSKALKVLKKTILIFIAILTILLISGYIYLYVLPKGPEVTEEKPIKEETDSFVMYAYKNSKRKSIRVWTYTPETWKNQDKILFVMHGGGRNADDYLDAWKEIANERNILVVAPEFENKFSRYTTNDYQEGNLFNFFGFENPKEEWAYSVVENIFKRIKKVNGLTNETYDIFGHSAGGQFVHRMIMLMPESHIGTGIAANAGFYTFPEANVAFPYGLENAGKQELTKAFKKKLVILLGELDKDPGLGTFRETDLAMKQGSHRLERGSNFYRSARSLARTKDLSFNWKIDTIKNVGHDYRNMSLKASEYLIAN